MINDIYHLGMGTTWIGKHWPSNKNYIYPNDKETHNYLNYFFENIEIGRIMVDTAREYGTAETRLGNYFQTHSEFYERAIICSKFGGCTKRQLLNDANNGFRITIEAMVNDYYNSLERLGRIDVYYSHLISQLNVNEVIKFLRKGEYLETLNYWKKIEYGGLKYIGASISNLKIMSIFIEEKLYKNLDIIQVPSWMVKKHESFIKELREFGKYIVVNSPVRFSLENNDSDISINDRYLEMWKSSYVDVVLTGTRNHYKNVVSLSKSV